MRPWLLLLVGCGNPISNQLLYEDEAFLAALPSTDRMAPPRDVRLARVGTSGLLQDAVEEAAALEGLALAVGATGEALRGAPPDERSAAIRSWRPVAAAARIDGESHSWSVRGEVVRPVGGSDFDWTLEIAGDDGEWVVVGTGTHDSTGVGLFTWDLAAQAELLGLPHPGVDVLDIDYIDGAEGEPRELNIDDGDLELGGTWRFGGDSLLVWFGTVVLVAGEPEVPGAAQVLHVPDLGGRGTGGVLGAAGELPFDICWDANGNDVYATGGSLPTVGSESSCPISF